MFRNKTSNKLGWVGGPGVVLPQGTINSVNCSLTALEEATVRCASLMESPDDHLTLPDGTTLPASPINRSRARQLWATDNSSSNKAMMR